MKKNPRLKLFLRVDASGRLIPGSGVERKSMPRTGRWKEIAADVCCTGLELSDTSIPALPYEDRVTTVTILCDANPEIVATPILNATTLAEVVDELNSKLGYLGVWKADGDGVSVVLKQEIVDDLACDGTLSVTVA